jgi:hypothetical protein
VQGRARQGVEQRHQQKHDVEGQGGDGAAQHDGMRIILNCERWIAALCARKKALRHQISALYRATVWSAQT